MPQRFRRYELVERIGLGGMAEVFRASGIGADGGSTPVVIKKILPALSGDAQFQEMFMDEARITAQLEHPNIVRLLDLGRMDAQLFLALELVEGTDLQRLLAKIEGDSKRLTQADTVYVMAGILDALEYAHRRMGADGKSLSIVHRDVSPGNVLLSRAGEVKLTDFGIAKGSNRTGHTMVGAIKGNLRYIAPEQITGGAVGPWSDTYACGMVLYRMAVGRYPIEFDALGTLVGMIVDGSIPKPYELDAQLPPALEKIISRSINRDPAARFASAKEFRDALLKYAADSKLALAPGGVAALVQMQLGPPKKEEPKTMVMPVAPVQVAEHESESEATGTVYVSKSFPAAPANPFQPEVVDADVEDVTRKSLVRRPRKTGEITGDFLTTDEVKPPFARGLGGESGDDGAFVVPGDLVLEEAGAVGRGQTLIEPRRTPPPSGGEDEDEKTAPTPMTRPRPTPPPPVEDPAPLAVPNLARDAGDDRPEWDALGQPAGPVTKPSAPVGAVTRPSAPAATKPGVPPPIAQPSTTRPSAPVVPSPSVTQPSAGALSATTDSFAIPVLAAPPPPSNAPPPLSLADDGVEEDEGTRPTAIPPREDSRSITARSAQTATPPAAVPKANATMAIGGFMGHRETVSSIAIAPSSRFVVTASHDTTVKIWDPATRRELRNLQGHEAAVTCVAISPDGRVIASGGRDKCVRFWDPISGKETFTLPPHEDWIFSIAWSNDGKRLVSSSADRTIRVWDLESRREILRSEGHAGIVTQVRFLPSWMRQMISAGYDATVRVWSLVDGKQVRSLGTPKMESVRALAISPEGAYAFSGGTDAQVRVWDLATGSVDAMSGHTAAVVALASPDGNILGSGSHDGTVKIWDVSARRELKTLRGHRGSVMALCFSPDGRYLLSGGDDKIVAIWQLGL